MSTYFDFFQAQVTNISHGEGIFFDILNKFNSLTHYHEILAFP